MPTVNPNPIEGQPTNGDKRQQNTTGPLPLENKDAGTTENFPVIAYNQRPLREMS